MNLKSVCLFLSLCQIGSAAALGLGELSVRSFLGQPLDATVAILGATPATTADCFSLTNSAGSIAPPLHAQFSLEKSGEQAVLHIRTPQSIYDPIAQFTLVSDCEARLQREYVALLDPPTTVAAVSRDLPAVPQATATDRVAAAPQAAAPVHRRARATHAPQAETGSRRHVTHRSRNASAPSPRLILSGKHLPASADTPFGLRLDTSLPDPSRPRPENLTPTELSDENTALNHKLAHLAAQLAALQQRNAELEAQRAATATPAKAAPVPTGPAQWPLYLLALAAVGTGAGLVAWLRQRGRSRPDLTLPETASPDVQPVTLAMLTEAAKAPDAESPPPVERMAEIAQPPRSEGTEVKEDILDQAEVFMAFGHGDLAVHLLQEHLRQAPTESPVPWLLLLDLLHRAGDTEGYAAASAECRRYFNVNLSNHPVSQDSETGQGLEAYPHLLEQLVSKWNSPDIDAFFHELIYDDRGGTRMGFEPGAYRDILMLREIARQSLPLAA